MNPQYEKQLEACVRRELDALGELAAPPALANRILQQLKPQPLAPWYRRAWPSWSLGLRFASLLVLIATFSGLCFGAVELVGLVTTHELTSGWISDAQALWRTAGVLGSIGCSFYDLLSTTTIVTGLALLFTAAAICFGVGSVCIRFALRPAAHQI
jgi:hypothetical protein